MEPEARHPRRTAAFVATAILAVILAVWVWNAYQKNTARTATVAIVKDAAERLNASLAPDVPNVADHVRAVEAHVERLKNIRVAAIAPLADAADNYLVTVREILRRRAAIDSVRERLAKSVPALAEHVQSDRGAAAWPKRAVELKQGADADLRELRIATESYTSLLDTLPEAQAKLAEFQNAAVATDPKLVQEAKKAALDALQRTDDNIRQVARIGQPHGRAAARR